MSLRDLSTDKPRKLPALSQSQFRRAFRVLATVLIVVLLISVVWFRGTFTYSWNGLRNPILFEGAVDGLGWLNKSRPSDGAVRSTEWKAKNDFDIVIAHYAEPLESVLELISIIKHSLPEKATCRTIIYSKGPESQMDGGLTEFMHNTGADEVIPLPNVGREGETYLQHIVRNYQSRDSQLAQQTFFAQGHLAWEGVAIPRINKVHSATGFVSFGPYLNGTCGEDSAGMSFPKMRDLYCAFRQELCPLTGQLITWAGQFLVSRTRILQNPLSTYQKLLDLFDAPPDHWIYHEGEGWWNNEPSNPTLGHALERSWPVVFNCTDPSVAYTCGEGSGATCECKDPLP